MSCDERFVPHSWLPAIFRLEQLARAQIVRAGNMKMPLMKQRANDGDRTRDTRLGKPVLYQLSYIRLQAVFLQNQWKLIFLGKKSIEKKEKGNR